MTSDPGQRKPLPPRDAGARCQSAARLRVSLFGRKLVELLARDLGAARRRQLLSGNADRTRHSSQRGDSLLGDFAATARLACAPGSGHGAVNRSRTDTEMVAGNELGEVPGPVTAVRWVAGSRQNGDGARKAVP